MELIIFLSKNIQTKTQFLIHAPYNYKPKQSQIEGRNRSLAMTEVEAPKYMIIASCNQDNTYTHGVCGDSSARIMGGNDVDVDVNGRKAESCLRLKFKSAYEKQILSCPIHNVTQKLVEKISHASCHFNLQLHRKMKG